MPGFAFASVGPLDLSSPPSRPGLPSPSLRYYAPLRLPLAHPESLRLSLASRYLVCLPTFVSPACTGLAAGWEATQPRRGLLVRRYPSSSGSSTRRQMALPSSRATPSSTCPALRPRWCPGPLPGPNPGLLPSALGRASAFPLAYRLRLSSRTTTIPISELNDAACTHATPGFAHPITGIARGFTSGLLARL